MKLMQTADGSNQEYRIDQEMSQEGGDEDDEPDDGVQDDLGDRTPEEPENEGADMEDGDSES